MVEIKQLFKETLSDKFEVVKTELDGFIIEDDFGVKLEVFLDKEKTRCLVLTSFEDYPCTDNIGLELTTNDWIEIRNRIDKLLGTENK